MDRPWCLVDLDVFDSLLPSIGHTGWASVEDDYERLEAIRIWIDGDHGGDAAKALRQSPILVSANWITSGLGTSHLMDGWHRLLIARDRELSTIPAIVIYGVGRLVHEPF